MKHPDKWRDTVDPFSLPYKHFQLKEVLGYPHAGNDVFHVRGIYDGREVRAFVKAARQKGASINNEVAILSQIDSPIFPAVIDYNLEGTPFSVTLELPGERLSTFLGDNDHLDSMAYMPEYGAALAGIHQWSLQAGDVKDRKFFHRPSEELLSGLGLDHLREYFSQPEKQPVRCFCHGDFHYANILWEQHHISGILDFELAGYGNRDFDIAWALFRRPGQSFLKSEEERNAFLEGYRRFGEYDPDAVKRYMAQCYVYFLQFRIDEEYESFVRGWLQSV